MKGCPNNIPFTEPPPTSTLQPSLPRLRTPSPAPSPRPRHGLAPAHPAIDFSFVGFSIVCYELSFGDVSSPDPRGPTTPLKSENDGVGANFRQAEFLQRRTPSSCGELDAFVARSLNPEDPCFRVHVRYPFDTPRATLEDKEASIYAITEVYISLYSFEVRRSYKNSELFQPSWTTVPA